MAEFIQASVLTSIINKSRFHIFQPKAPFNFIKSYFHCYGLGLQLGAITSKVEYDLVVNSIKSFISRNNMNRDISIIFGLIAPSRSQKPVESTQQFLHIGEFPDKSFFIENNTFPWASNEPNLSKKYSSVCTVMRSETNFLYHAEKCSSPLGDLFICRENLKDMPSSLPTNSPTTSPSVSPTFSPTPSPSNLPSVSPSNLSTISPTAVTIEVTSVPTKFPIIGEIEMEYDITYKLCLAGFFFAMILITTLSKVYYKFRSNRKKLESELFLVKDQLDSTSSSHSTQGILNDINTT